MNRILFIKIMLAIVVINITVTGCKKDEGPGGTSTIKGKVIVYDFDSGFLSPAPAAIYPAIDENVYVIYGEDGTTYNDDFKTSYDGTYEFKYLQKGKYKLFAYSKDSTGASVFDPSLEKIPSFINVEITSNGSTVNAPDLIILDNNQ